MFQVLPIMVISRIHLITCFVLLSNFSTAQITFSLTNINPQNQNRDIVIQGNGASISDGGIQLTRNMNGSDQSFNSGRAIYVNPLHLWDNRSRGLVSFSTNFTFVIDSNRSSSYGDGLTFFLADNNSVISQGGAMGLPFISTPNNASNRFVAVEFDTFWNSGWDPVDGRDVIVGDHVGIDVSSVSSARFQKWFSNVTGGGVCQAWITYDAVSKNLSVSFTSFENNTVGRQDGLVYTVDLRRELPEWVIFGFSAATGASFQINTVRSWSFNSSDFVVDRNTEEPPVGSPDSFNPSPGNDTLIPSPDTGKGKNSKAGLVTGLSVTITFVVVLAFAFAFAFWRRRKRKKKKSKEDELEEIGFDVEMNHEFEMGTRPKQFTYLELAESTSDFAENNKLAEGGFGRVYRGFMKDSNTYIAVKRVSKSSKQGMEEYLSEVRIITQLRHKNLVQLTGWCHEKGELLLVYDYMENGSLDSHLFNAKSLLTWGARYKIANGLASALWYLHEGWEQCVLHRDIKPSKVLLDSNFNAKLGDFGLAKLIDHEKDTETMMLARKATKESDVFSFGVVALELACGKKSIEKVQEKPPPLIEWVWELYGTNNLIEAVDPHLGSEFVEEEISRLMIVGLWCVHPHAELRPLMRQVIQVLNSQASLPVLPSSMPVVSNMTSRILSVFGVASII
ncbi:putative protein kinase RLK-Pelle-L-LEC family [Helianthus annuus]|nr:putative protein kinase RLK-Pelle-L-LEC family [Helianthus annuus]KAJ0541687.1 putative protein kinase RLK-Pelle-L-LEC family [Helianthus annuus]KAJ0706761.1 putative protein kinase RLK-Pelle-L-LEC family [Helianthus annuus]KAJ0752724.1 putative protein kinase RLK-Pelle-L-LEC family [Helianthus annuus]KAJ0887354.1 putative protein kinase RLK-Pelle-L-LEC family [Helianthus annuus]